MNTSISIEEYKDIIDKLEIINISLIEAQIKFDKELMEKDLKLDIKEKVKHSQDDYNVEFDFQYSLKGKSQDMDGTALTINAKYHIIYRKEISFKIKDEFFEPFVRFVLKMMIWTYYREYVQNTVTRMNLPPLTLPLKRI